MCDVKTKTRRMRIATLILWGRVTDEFAFERDGVNWQQARRITAADQFAESDHHRGDGGRRASGALADGHCHGTVRSSVHVERDDGPRENRRRATVQHRPTGAGAGEYRRGSGRRYILA